MARRLKKSAKTFILMMIVVILTAAICFVSYFALTAPQNDLSDLPDDTVVKLPDSGNQIKPGETSKQDKVQVDLVDYTVYDLDAVDFRFIIAKVRVKADTPTNISLNHFTTSEGIVLNQVQDYVSQLEAKSLFLGKKNVWFELVSTQTNYIANIFIPVKDKTLSSVSLNSDFKDTQIIKFELDAAAGTAEDLGYVAEDIISDGRTYQMQVSSAYLISDEFTRTYESGYTEAYLLPSSAEIHAFYVEAVSLWGDAVEIESAWYQVEGSSEKFEALNGQFSTVKYENIMNTTILDKQSGYIFFVSLNPESEPIVYHGTLTIQLKNSNQPILIQVDLR